MNVSKKFIEANGCGGLYPPKNNRGYNPRHPKKAALNIQSDFFFSILITSTQYFSANSYSYQAIKPRLQLFQ